MRKCKTEEIIKAVPEVHTLLLPHGWFEDLPLSTDVFNVMYQWMLSEGMVSNEVRPLPGRTYVGDKLYSQLLAAEKKRLRAKLKVSGEELQNALDWSANDCGPYNLIGGVPIAGDVILVVPEASRDAMGNLASKLLKETRESEVRKVQGRAAGATYYQWLISQVDRRDRVGDSARDAAADTSYPRESNDYYELRSYMNKNASAAAIDSFKLGWLEYLEKYPRRVPPIAWCAECDRKVEVADAFMAWSAESGDLCVLDAQCLSKYRSFDEMDSRPLAGIRTVDLEDLVGAEISELDIENTVRDLRLWGVLPPAEPIGWVYFIRAEDTHRIKIGFTAGEVEKRRRSLQTSNAGDLTIVGTIKGTQQYEKDLHQRFSAYRLNGEWFEPHPELLAFISVLPQK